jgi:hypothetical protein
MPAPHFLLPDGQVNLAELRREYLAAVANGAKVNALLDRLARLPAPPPLVVAFQGALETLKARDLWNPLEKLKWSEQSQATLARAVAADPDNLEIRFLRYSIQHGLPSYLGLSRHLAQDRAAMMAQIAAGVALEMASQQAIVDFLLKHARCTEAEKHLLHQWLDQPASI